MNDPRPQTEGEGLYEKYMLHHPADIRGCLKQLVDKRCVLLVRTGPPGSAHRGITALFVDMDTPGIAVRPFGSMHGVEEFTEVFFDDPLALIREHPDLYGVLAEFYRQDPASGCEP